jgi:hypothetical protein
MCCLRVRLPDVEDVPAHGSVLVDVEVSIATPGPLSDSVSLYLDDGGLREVALTVVGTAVEKPTVRP